MSSTSQRCHYCNLSIWLFSLIQPTMVDMNSNDSLVMRWIVMRSSGKKLVIYHLNILSTFMMRVNIFLKSFISKSYKHKLQRVPGEQTKSCIGWRRDGALDLSIEDFFLWDESDVRKKILRHIYYTVSSLLKNNMEKRNSKMDKTRNKEIKPSKSGLKDHIQKRKSVDILNLNSKFGMERLNQTYTPKEYHKALHMPPTLILTSAPMFTQSVK